MDDIVIMEIIKNGIKVVYDGGIGNSTATISASGNEGIDREADFVLETSNEGEKANQTLSVTQAGRREKFLYQDGGELPIYVLKEN